MRRNLTLKELYQRMESWPKNWAMSPGDFARGRSLIAQLRPFVAHLHGSGLAPTTMLRHMNHLDCLGGYLIEERNQEDEPGPVPPLMEVVGPEDGPLLHHNVSEAEQNAFDATCRKLHAFLADTTPSPARQPRQPRKPVRPAAAPSAKVLRQMIEDATMDAHDQDEQLGGFLCMFEEHLELPFTTEVLGVEVQVMGVELPDTGTFGILALCRRGKVQQRIPITELPLPTPPPSGAEWIAAYRAWGG